MGADAEAADRRGVVCRGSRCGGGRATPRSTTGALVVLASAAGTNGDVIEEGGEVRGGARGAGVGRRDDRDRSGRWLCKDPRHRSRSTPSRGTRKPLLRSPIHPMTRKWAEAGQSGEPNTARVTQYRIRLDERRSAIGPLRIEYARLVSGYRTWLGEQALRERERQIAELLASEDASTESAVGEHLEKRVTAAQKSLELAQAARNRMEQVGKLMQEKAETFTGDVLSPLNITIQRFARTLMTWPDASIIYRAEHHTTRSELRPRIIRKEDSATYLSHICLRWSAWILGCCLLVNRV